MNFLNKISKALNTLLLWLGGGILVLMMCLACANMVLRGVWVPIKGSYELMGFFGALVAAFSLGYTQMGKGHIALTIMSGVFPKRVERCIDAFSYFVCSFFFGLIGWRTCVWAASLARSGEVSETLRIVYYPFPFAVAFGVFVLALALLVDFLKVVGELRGGKAS